MSVVPVITKSPLFVLTTDEKWALRHTAILKSAYHESYVYNENFRACAEHLGTQARDTRFGTLCSRESWTLGSEHKKGRAIQQMLRWNSWSYMLLLEVALMYVRYMMSKLKERCSQVKR
jgi:hypothetical protein